VCRAECVVLRFYSSHTAPHEGEKPDAQVSNKATDRRFDQRSEIQIEGGKWQAINGIGAPPGTEFNHQGWPPNFEVEAINEPAKRVSAYNEKHRTDAFRPETPRSVGFGRYFLPAVTDPRSSMVYIVPEDRAYPKMPRYKALRDLAEDWSSSRRRFPHRSIKEGEIVAIVSWPNWTRDEFEPVNPSAEAVQAYYAAAKGHDHLLSSPWCEFYRDIFLPALSAIKAGGLNVGSPAVPEMA
jgi:hypothetical protein